MKLAWCGLKVFEASLSCTKTRQEPFFSFFDYDLAT